MTFVCGRGQTPARERVETEKMQITRAVAIKGENRMAQTGKKLERNRISEEDWKKYVDAVRRNARGRTTIPEREREK